MVNAEASYIFWVGDLFLINALCRLSPDWEKGQVVIFFFGHGKSMVNQIHYKNIGVVLFGVIMRRDVLHM
jgi:hypothetical protein